MRTSSRYAACAHENVPHVLWTHCVCMCVLRVSVLREHVCLCMRVCVLCVHACLCVRIHCICVRVCVRVLPAHTWYLPSTFL